MKKLLSIHLVSALLLLAIIGCGGAKQTPAARAGEKLRIVTTTGMVTDVVQRVAGDQAEVTGLMGPGVDPHLYKASYGDVQQLDRADIVFYSGLHLEGKMTDILEKISRSKPAVAVAEAVPESRRRAPQQGTVGQWDPHVWMDPTLWKNTLEPIVETLSEARPEQAAVFRARADSLAAQFDSLAGWAKSELSAIPRERRVLVTAHDAFGYFGQAFDVEVVALQGVSTATDFGLADVQNLVNLLAERKIKAVFVESSVPTKPLEAVIGGARSRGHEVKIGGTLFSDAMGAPGTPEGTYIGMIRHNVNTIAQALR